MSAWTADEGRDLVHTARIGVQSPVRPDLTGQYPVSYRNLNRRRSVIWNRCWMRLTRWGR